MNDGTESLDARARDEAQFHDARVELHQGARLGYAYASVTDVYEFARLSPMEHAGRSVLEVGCFLGEQARCAQAFQGKYVGIDISGAAVKHCISLGLPPHFEFRVDDANVLSTIADGSVEYAFGHGVLHHLDLPSFGSALSRKLAPGGRACFVEPAQGNFLLRLFRKLTPKLRTDDEFPFDRRSIEQLQQHFEVKVTYHALLRPFVPMLFLNTRPITRLARRLDDLLLKSRWLQSQAWLLQIELRKA